MKFAVPLMLCGVLVFLGIMQSGLTTIKSSNFTIQCGNRYMDGTSDLEVIIDGKTYIGIQRRDDCERISQISGSEITMIGRSGNLSFLGLQLDGKVIQSETTIKLLSAFGVFAILALTWSAVVSFSNRRT